MLVSFLCIIMTIVSYIIAKFIYKKSKLFILSPLIVAPVLLSSCIILLGVDYTDYDKGGRWLTNMLQPAVVGFAVPLYKYRAVLKKHMRVILVSMTSGAIVALASSGIYAHLVHLKNDYLLSLLPRSVTTPIAMVISADIGGVPTMTAIFVIVTGICGLILGPIIIRFFHIREKLAKGLLLGMGAHGAGTSKALEFGTEEGAAASLAMVVAALLTLIFAPIITPFILL
ncbi:CidB/LrgB family autolysis modulator [Terrilactibacillus sp. BCM23-1]|uniref:CidB/LrgB family autolysis modulator n=1 Tax=Terrilactibacillus tamarindi TaxID=2599694 RepID=A0A6N8CRB7_9BACI|nr:LrgB family protein [Terrilactibacillus tamarindi]MTT32722.1 CidB/LrgB family autolysis modulator [Terrilactibacillus tamarindi]